MKITEVIDTNLNLGNGETIIIISLEDKKQAQVQFNFDFEWNRDETKRIVTESWVESIELFNDGTEIELPSWQQLEISMFAHANINDEYIEKLIN